MWHHLGKEKGSAEVEVSKRCGGSIPACGIGNCGSRLRRFLRKERAMGKKRLLCGLMVVMFLWSVTVAHALVSNKTDPSDPNNPDPGTCSVFPFVGVLNQPFPMTFALILQNYLSGPVTFQVRAFIGGTVLRAVNIRVESDGFRGLAPVDIPILAGELADLYVCWPVGAVGALVPPGALLFLIIGSSYVLEPPVVSFFIP
jgi:hypothetical protein